MSKREELLLRAKEIKKSANNNYDELSLSQLEKEIAGLYYTLPMEWLRKNQIKNGKAIPGFLYNNQFENYVSVDSNGKFLYADKETIADGAILFFLKYDTSSDPEFPWNLKAFKYFNWRDLTGACKLQNPYVPISINFITQNSDETIFNIYALGPKQYAGCWSNTDNELYVRSDSVARSFKFQMINSDAFTEDDKMIYEIMIKQYYS